MKMGSRLMKMRIASLVMLIAAASHPAFAETAGKKISASCKAQARGLDDVQRDEFLQQCIRSKTVRHGAHPRRRAPSCTALAQNRRGDDRRDFLRKCRERYR
ncbi:MAG TPA: hypothetical protein VN361_05960 [Oxalicibacterium sp.]|nr:hypothetical protein [Oxalicibacterium sp.]